jgi:uncharacterized repeat protein (TIGR02543 family)
VLYRSSSPVDPRRERNVFADAALRAAGIATILNLDDDAQSVVAHEGYEESGYASCAHIELSMGYQYDADDFRKKLVRGLRFMIEEPGPYLVHCLEGKDRTGVVVAALECLMGAGADEVVADYMTTFYNFYGVVSGEQRYDAIARTWVQGMEKLLGVEDFYASDLAAAAESYLSGLGLSDAEIAALRARLAGKPVSCTLRFDTQGHGAAPADQVVPTGQKASAPDAPEAKGFVFDGWYTDAACAKAWDFATPVTEDLTLYAKWVKLPSGAFDGPTAGAPTLARVG